MGGSGHQESPGGSRNKGVAELNNDTHDECKEVRDGIMGEGQELSAEDESRINDGREGAVAPAALKAALQKQQQQQLPPGPIVRWEKILPVRTLKVLLVESDDSTRQVVSALLRNCSYEGIHHSYISFFLTFLDLWVHVVTC